MSVEQLSLARRPSELHKKLHFSSAEGVRCSGAASGYHNRDQRPREEVENDSARSKQPPNPKGFGTSQSVPSLLLTIVDGCKSRPPRPLLRVGKSLETLDGNLQSGSMDPHSMISLRVTVPRGHHRKAGPGATYRSPRLQNFIVFRCFNSSMSMCVQVSSRDACCSTSSRPANLQARQHRQ